MATLTATDAGKRAKMKDTPFILVVKQRVRRSQGQASCGHERHVTVACGSLGLDGCTQGSGPCCCVTMDDRTYTRATHPTKTGDKLHPATPI